MSKNFYLKRGNKNYKEKRLLKELGDFFEKNPDVLTSVEPAESYDELQSMYDKYVFDDYQELDEKEEKSTPADSEKLDTNVDPLNRQNPNIRDYVLDNANGQSTAASSFNEPISFDDTFEIPAENDDPFEEPKAPRAKKVEKEAPIFNDGVYIDPKKKRRKTERFAKSIVNLVCDLWQTGFVWFVTKDITDEKLIQYEQEFGMDLELLLELNDGQKTTVRNFFISQRVVAQQVSEIGKEDREDLTDALIEVFLEKGIQPTAAQDLLLVVAKVFGGSTLQGVAIAKPISMIVGQCKQEAESRQQEQPYSNPEPAPQPAPEPTKQAETIDSIDETDFDLISFPEIVDEND